MVSPIGEVTFDKEEPIENLITWVYENGSFVPIGKLTDNEGFSVVSDYLGTPVQAYDQSGNLIWERELDIYGRVRKEKGISNFVPFRYQGQYYDSEIDLCYNRFRYYDCNTGTYISQDPIGLLGNNPNFYAYVKDTNTWVDIFGLDCFKAKTNSGEYVDVFRGGKDFTLKLGEFKVTPNGKYPARGLSLNTDASKVAPYGGAYKVIEMPEGLDVIHTPSSNNPLHFDVIPKELNISEAEFQNLLYKIKVESL